MTDPAATTQPRPWADRAAFAVSALTSPYLVAAVTAVLMVYYLHPTPPQLLVWGGTCLLFAAVIPFAVVYLLRRAGQVTDMHVALRRQRALPFVATLISVACGIVVLRMLSAPPALLALGVAFLANGAALTLVSLRWKISAHSAVFSAGTFALALLGHPEVLWALVLVPLILWARVYRRRHTLWQGLIPVALTAILTPLAFHATMRVLTS
jgi:hypothetical protein